jgi:hypothetical protein
LKRIRINPNSVEFYNVTPVCAHFKDSILICDDIEAYDKKTMVRVMSLVNSIATTGRNNNVSLMMLCHTATNGAMSELLLSECHAIVVFPANMTGKSSKYLLDKNQIKNIYNVNSRHIAILRSYPMVVQSERFIMPLSQF